MSDTKALTAPAWDSEMSIYPGLSATVAGHNESSVALLETALQRGEGKLCADGAFVAETGEFTGRSPKDKHIVVRPDTQRDIWWDGNNRMMPDAFERLRSDMFSYLSARDVQVQDLLCGADPQHAVRIRLIAEFAWHALFLNHLLIVPTRAERDGFEADFTIINAPGFRADPARHGCRSETVIALDFERRLVLIGGTEYAGENKKAAFTILNHLYPERGILPMHCSANHRHGDSGDVAIFFGLSGTGKTTLSAESARTLIGDDEHGWSEHGVFNFEGGCYAKTIDLREDQEPEIWQAAHRFGTVLENVILDPETRRPDFSDRSLTENTRAAYPMSLLGNASRTRSGGVPRHVFLLTCDAYGVTPPILRLTPDKARELFLLGFTSKVAGTERGVAGPTPTFSTCFAAPFLTRDPRVYADLFAERLRQSEAACWLLNTGWTGGSAGIGTRMPLASTRSLLNAVLAGEMDDMDMIEDPVWGLPRPASAPDDIQPFLDPRKTWSNPSEFDDASGRLKELISVQLSRISPRSSEDAAT